MTDYEAYARPAPVPKMVQDFVTYFYRHIRERNLREVTQMYTHTFPHLSERFFKGASWPPVEGVAHLVDDDHVFCMLYKELYFRHLHANARPTLEQRAESWENYREVFSLILTKAVNMQLPNQWLWDMVDEFVYQYQSFSQNRGKLTGKSDAEIQQLRAMEGHAWDTQAVLAILTELVSASNIRQELGAPGGIERLWETEGYDPQRSNVRRMLGYFSLVGLLRVYAILGNHSQALQAMVPLHPFERKGLYITRIPMANVTMFYYCGFAYLMMQRYLDAAKCFNFILNQIAKVKNNAALQRTASYDQVLKKNEQIYALLAITTALCPTTNRLLDEGVATALREKLGEKVRQCSNGSVETYEELFAYGCPKFVSALPPAWDNHSSNTNLEAYRSQLQAFRAVVEERKHLPALKQFLKLYSSIPLDKLASLAEMDTATLKSQLELLRASTQVVTWSGGDALAGKPVPAGDIEFSIVEQEGKEMVVVAEPKTKTVKGDFLLRHIARFDEIVRELDSIATRPQEPAAVAAA